MLTILQWTATKVHVFLHNSRFAHVFVEVTGLILAVFIGMLVYRHYQPTLTTTVIQPGINTTVTVDRPVLTTKIVTKVLSDPKDKAAIASLMAENAKLKQDVTSLTQTLTELHQTGGGVIARVDPPADKPNDPVSYAYKDWHLKFNTDLKTATYDLFQQFEILTTTAKNKDGVQSSQTALYELGANGERIAATNTKITGIFTDATSPHWLVLPIRVQSGVGYFRDKAGVQAPGGVVVIQWLKHGRTKATEDVTFAVASPAFLFGQNMQDIGILPVSWNFGRKLPGFSNLWLSPYIGRGPKFGIVFTATF